MLPLYPRMRPPGLLGALPTFALGFLVGLLTLHLYTFSSSVVTGPRLQTTTTTSLRPSPPHPESSSRHIPPVVHFIQLKPAPDAELHFSFEAYLAFYAAYRAVRPTAIHLHTDFPPADVERARERGSSWTRRLLSLFPHVLHIHHVVAPTHAGPPSSPSSPYQPSLPILRIEHKSDLLRLDALSTYYPATTTTTTSKSTTPPHHPSDDAESAEGTGGGDDGSGSIGGGIYLDWDVLTLRSPRPLLRSNFPFIAGRQPDGFLNNGILLARADSAALALLRRETPLAFDGGWITHSVGLLTRLVTAVDGATAAAAAAAAGTTTTTTEGEAEGESDGEILVLDHKACAPFSWEQADVDVLLARHEGDPASIGNSSSSGTTTPDDLPTREDEEDEQQRSRHPLARAYHHQRPRRPWERDLGDAYFLHKFFNDVDDPPGYRGVSVPYVLARDSNYAVAAWPIVRDGIREGFIDEFDAML